MTSFWHMGGYAVYVWSAYGIGLGILLLQLAAAKFKLGQLRKMLSRKYAKSS